MLDGRFEPEFYWSLSEEKVSTGNPVGETETETADLILVLVSLTALVTVAGLFVLQFV